MRSERRRIWNGLLFAVLFTLLAFVSVGCAGDTYTVCPGGGCDYTIIQAAIDNATVGDTIEVWSGTYYENVNVNKQLILRGVNTGGGKPVVDAGGNGYPIRLLIANGITVDGFTAINASGGYAGILVLSSNNIITNNTASNNEYGIFLDVSNSNSLTGNTASNSSNYGICLYNSCNNNLTGNIANSNNNSGIYMYYSSNNNTLTGNTADSNYWYGIYLYSSSNNSLTGNTVDSNNDCGISVYASSNNNTLTDNIASNNSNGIYLSFSSNNNSLTGNAVNSNTYRGIYLYSSSNNTLSNNTANSNNEFGIYLESSSNNTLAGNTASNNSIRGIYLYSSSNDNTLTGNTASDNNNHGIRLHDLCNNNTLTGNIASNNGYGIILEYSSNNTLSNNTAHSNNYRGIHLYNSSTNLIYNNYFNNTQNAYDNGLNIWNITQTPGINVIGGSSLGGNYWSDYNGEDTNDDGFGDTAVPYKSSGKIVNGGDWLPLVKAEEPIFDTGEGSYPSISGTFTGTITPSRNLTVSTLYTYSCTGTGGHTKSFNLYENDTLRATGVWSGYQGDWHNITFSEVTLLKDHEYRYVIVTGSYPQIIHAESKDVTGGTITFEEFVDVNGKQHEGWIPAIRLS